MNSESPAKNLSPVHDANGLLKDAESLLHYGTWVWTQDTGTMEWSHGLYRLLGYAHTDTGPMFIDDFLLHLPGGDRDRFMTYVNTSIERHIQFQLIHTVCTVRGTSVQVLTKGNFVSTGKNIYIQGATQDVTGLPKVHTDVSQQQKLMRQYEVFLKFGTWQHDAITQHMQWSVGMYNLFGYDLQEEKDLAVTEAIYQKHLQPEDYQKGLALRKEAENNNHNEFFWQYRIITTNGSHKWLETYGHIDRDTEGKVIATFGITRDITRLKLYEHSLESKIKELNRSNAELEEFAYVASHDMQEPLRKLITFSERLNAKFAEVLQDEGRLYLNRMVAATNNMRLLIDNLLDFSRVARTAEEFAPVDLNTVLQKIITDLDVSIEETQATITADDLPVIEAQAPQMQQLFTNVISNAIKFRTPGVPPQINIYCAPVSTREAERLHLEADNKYFKIEVKDNGIGFEPEYAQRIFQIFQRLHGKAEYPGSGIGLAICKKIVDYHNGIMYANGQLNEGATITIILPEKH